MQPVPLDIFLVVKLASQINFAHVNTNHVVDSLGYNHAYLLKPICVLRACKFFFLLKILTRMCHVFLYVGSSDEFFSVEIHPVRILLREQDIYEWENWLVRSLQLSLKEGPRSANIMESPCIAVSVKVLTTTRRATTNTHYRTNELLWKKMIQQSFRYNLCVMCIVTSFPWLIESLCMVEPNANDREPFKWSE